jgi:hypothetical protein
MRVSLSLAALAATLALGSTPAAAAHNNPWAGPEDSVEAQFHDDNQERSAETPGSDEMHGMEKGVAAGRDTVPGPGSASGPGSVPGDRSGRD